MFQASRRNLAEMGVPVCRPCYDVDKIFGTTRVKAWLPMTAAGGLSIHWGFRLSRWYNTDKTFARESHKARYYAQQKVEEILRRELDRSRPRFATPWIVAILSGRSVKAIVRKIVRYYIWLASRDAIQYDDHPKTLAHCQASLVAYLLLTTHRDCRCGVVRDKRKTATLFTSIRNIIVEIETVIDPLLRLVCRKVHTSETQPQTVRRADPERFAAPINHIWHKTAHLPQVRPSRTRG